MHKTQKLLCSSNMLCSKTEWSELLTDVQAQPNAKMMLATLLLKMDNGPSFKSWLVDWVFNCHYQQRYRKSFAVFSKSTIYIRNTLNDREATLFYTYEKYKMENLLYVGAWGNVMSSIFYLKIILQRSWKDSLKNL